MTSRRTVLFFAALAFAAAASAQEVRYAARFSVVAPEAPTVDVAGDFSEWETLPLVRDEQGVWSRTFYLAPGSYHYKFKVGDEWRFDAGNPRQEDDGKGVINSVIAVQAPAPSAPPATPGALALSPDSYVQFDIPHSGTSWSDAKKYAGARGQKLDAAAARTGKVRVGLLLPPGFDPAKSWPILVVNAPGDFSCVGHLECCFTIAAEAGYVALAADGPITRFFSGASALDYLRSQWPGSAQWPVVCGGFSGGAKVSGEIAAMLANSGRRILGIWMGGCNEDYASSGLNLYRPNAMTFKRVPIFLASGDTDIIATPAQAEGVRQSLLRTGFRNVRLETYRGGHHPVPPHMVKQGLLWFLEQAAAAPRPGGRIAPPPSLPPLRRP